MISIIQHPIAESNLTIMRDKNTNSCQYREATKKISYILAIEAYKDLHTNTISIETPLEKTTGEQINQDVILLPVLRAGLSMLEPFQVIYPPAKIAVIGLKRDDETLETDEYYYSTPQINNNTSIFILDPMIATGNSIYTTLCRLQLDCAENISVVSIISAPQGIEKIMTHFPKVKIFTASLDRDINKKGYIVPGIGNAGNRFCGE